MPGEEGLGEEVVDEFGRLVLVHEDLFEDHLALGLDLVGPEGGSADDVAEDVEAQVEVLVEEAGVEGRVLLGGEGVHLAADGLDRLGDLASRALFGALEQQVLEEVGDAGQFRTLVPRPDIDPEAERHRAYVGHPLADETDAVAEC